MRCLHCGKRLTILRKLSDHEFCSDEHRAAFSREQEQLALSRLIDAQLQSQQPGRKRDKKKPEPPPVEVTDAEPVAKPPEVQGFLNQMPAVAESGWRAYCRDAAPLPGPSPEWMLPRFPDLLHAHRVPAGVRVWPDIRASVRGVAASLREVAADHLCGDATPLGVFRERAGLGDRLAPGVAPDLRILEAPEPLAAPVDELPLAPAPMQPWSGAPVARSLPTLHAAITPEPVLLEASGPNARPRATAGIAAGVPWGSAEAGRPKILLRLAGPAPRWTAARHAGIDALPDWVAAPAIASGIRVTPARLQVGGCRRLNLDRMAAGSFAKVEIQEPPVGLPVSFSLPHQDCPDAPAGLLLAPGAPIPFPQADCGRTLLGLYPKAEPAPPYLMAPRSNGPAQPRFDPPMFGMVQLALRSRTDRGPADYPRRHTAKPFLPAVQPKTRPAFSAPLLCDWVPVRARMMALPVEIVVRDTPARLHPGEPDDARGTVPAPPPARILPAGAPCMKGEASKLRRITLDGVMLHRDGIRPRALLDHEPIETGKRLPHANLRLLKDRPTLEIERRLTAPVWRKALYSGKDLWSGMPAVARVSAAFLVIALAALLGMPDTGQSGKADLQATLAGGWEHMQTNILKRAAVALTDDFRAGLAHWEGEGDWARAWSYDQSGFVRTGPLALYTPSLPLTNYRMEFLGQIEKRSLGWVVRAANADNYYAVKLTVADPGPVPEVLIERYPVIGGRPGPVQRKRLPVQVRMDTLYRVHMELRDNDFALSVQGQVVDNWSEPRLPRGGVGFFSAKGELARLRWVGVWHQYDTLGRLCALLAPQGIADRQRGVSQ